MTVVKVSIAPQYVPGHHFPKHDASSSPTTVTGALRHASIKTSANSTINIPPTHTPPIPRHPHPPPPPPTKNKIQPTSTRRRRLLRPLRLRLLYQPLLPRIFSFDMVAFRLRR